MLDNRRSRMMSRSTRSSDPTMERRLSCERTRFCVSVRVPIRQPTKSSRQARKTSAEAARIRLLTTSLRFLFEDAGRDLDARDPEPVDELGTDAGGAEIALHRAVVGNALALEDEHVLHGDHVAFHAGDLG